MPKEKADELKAKYNLTEETIQDVISGLKVANTPGAAVEEEAEEELPPPTGPDIFSKLGKGEVSMGEALIWLDYQDRKDERRKATQSPVTPEKIALAVVKEIKEALPPTAKTQDEMPPWAKKQAEQLERITSKLMKEEEDNRLKEAVDAAVKPVADQLVKTTEDLAKLKEEAKETATAKKGELETTKDTLKTLKELDELRGKPMMPEKAKEVMIDLNEEVAVALGDEIKKAVVDAVHEKLSGEKGEGAPPVTTTAEGKVQIDWYNLGNRVLKTIDKFIEKLPVTAPPKKEVKEMPPAKPPQLPPITTPAPPLVPPPPPPQFVVVTRTPPPTEKVATATHTEERSTLPEEPQPQPTQPPIEEPETPEEKPEEPPKTEVKTQKASKKNEKQKEEAEEQKTIIAESTTKEAVVEQKVSKTGGSEETLHGGSHTEKSRGESTEGN